MKLSLSRDHNPNYVAKVVKIKEIKPIKGADKIVQVIVDGFSVVVSNTTKVGDVFVFCPVESVLNDYILRQNNLYSDMYLNQNYADLTEEEALDPDLELPTGFFNKYGRVKPINLRKTPSQGFLASPEMFKCINGGVTPDLSDQIGTSFDSIGGVPFIWKYVPANIKVSEDGSGRKKRVNDKFSFHYNTAVLNRNLHKLVINNYVNITTKVHGTSAVFGHYNETKGLINRIKRLFGFKPTSYVYSSMKVIRHPNHNSLWSKVGNAIKDSIEVDTTVYGEIIGFHNGGYIQKDYDYGCLQSGGCIFMPYRVVKHEDGGDRELTVTEVIDFTESLVSVDNDVTVDSLDVLFSATMLELLDRYKIDFTNREDDSYWQDELLEALKNDKEFRMEMTEPLCRNKVPREGIVFRFTSDGIPEAFKLKCQSFYLYETKQLDMGDGGELDE